MSSSCPRYDGMPCNEPPGHRGAHRAFKTDSDGVVWNYMWEVPFWSEVYEPLMPASALRAELALLKSA